MAGSVRRVWVMQHQTGAQYSAVDWTRAKIAVVALLLLQHPNQSQQAASRVRRVMSTFCEVTRGVGDTWPSCPTLSEVFGLRVNRQCFVVMIDFQLRNVKRSRNVMQLLTKFWKKPESSLPFNCYQSNKSEAFQSSAPRWKFSFIIQSKLIIFARNWSGFCSKCMCIGQFTGRNTHA